MYTAILKSNNGPKVAKLNPIYRKVTRKEGILTILYSNVFYSAKY